MYKSKISKIFSENNREMNNQKGYNREDSKFTRYPNDREDSKFTRYPNDIYLLIKCKI